MPRRSPARPAPISCWRRCGDYALRVAHAADPIGIRGIIVHAMSEQAKAFYLALGFDPSPAEPMTVMVTVADIWSLVAELGTGCRLHRTPPDQDVAIDSGTRLVKYVIWIIALGLAPAPHALPARNAPPDAKQFVAHLYAHYEKPDMVDGYLGRQAPDVFAPRLLAAVRAEQAASEGEIGKYYYDP